MLDAHSGLLGWICDLHNTKTTEKQESNMPSCNGTAAVFRSAVPKKWRKTKGCQVCVKKSLNNNMFISFQGTLAKPNTIFLLQYARTKQLNYTNRTSKLKEKMH